MKNNIRQSQKQKRRLLNPDERRKFDEAIANTFLAAFGGYNSYFIYNSFGTEVGTSLIISKLLRAGKEVYLPRVEGENIVAVPYGSTKKGAFGIEEPQGQALSGETEITVIPLLAVNCEGFRIGYGKGYYDRYLKNKNTLKIGLGYSFQTENFQGDTWDEPLDFFISEKGLVGYMKNTAN